MHSVDHARLAQLVARIEAWPSALEQHGRHALSAATASSSSLRSGDASSGYAGSAAAANRAIAQRRRVERVHLTSSLRAPATAATARSSFGTVPQRQPVYGLRPTVGPELGPGSHDADLRGDVAKVREPQRPSPVFKSGKLMPLGPKRAADPLAGVNGAVGVPDLLTCKREKVPDLVSTTFHSTTERFGDTGMLERIRLSRQRLPPPASAFPFDTGLAVRTPTWNFDDDDDGVSADPDEAAVPEAEVE